MLASDNNMHEIFLMSYSPLPLLLRWFRQICIGNLHSEVDSKGKEAHTLYHLPTKHIK